MPAIASNLDLANQALCLLGEMTITALGTAGNKPSLFADRFVDQAIYETQSMADWRECIKRATISAGSAPTYGATATFSLPADCIRVLEVNASTSADDTLPFHIEGTKIVASASTIYIRYIAQTAIASCGPLLQQACAVRLAAKLALPLTGSQERLAAMESLFSKTIGEAMAKETAEHPLTKIALERVGVVPSTLSPDTLRRIRTFADESRKEVLRRTYASEATALTSMDTLAQAAVHALHAAKIATALSLPSAPQFEELFQLRMREARLRALQSSALNGRVLAMIGSDLASRDLSDTALTEIGTFADEARKEVNRMTYVSEATALGSMDTLAQECVDILHARKIATYLSLPQANDFEALFTKKILEAKNRTLQTSALNGRVLAMIGADLVTRDLSDSILTELVTNLADDARKEVLRRTYQNESTVIGSMDTLAQAAVDALHAAKIAHYLNLPNLSELEALAEKKIQEAKARALQTSALNGRVLAMIGADLVTRDLSDTALTEIGTFADEARKEVNRMTYTSEATALGSMDTLAQECVDILHARKIATYLSLPQLADFEALFTKKIQEAKARAIHTSGINGRILAMIGADLVTRDLSPEILTVLTTTLATDAKNEICRRTYISEATALGSMDTTSKAAVDALHAAKIAHYLNLPNLSELEALAEKKIQEAKARALQTSALNGRVLAMIGADLVTRDLSDSILTELVTNLADDARKEVLRTGLFASAIEIATLSSSLGSLAGKTHSYALPSDCLSLLEISSDSAGETLLDYELIDQKIAVSGTPVYVRYIKDQTITDLDVLAQSTIDALHAAKIAHYLTLPSLGNHEELFQLRLRQARKSALDESDISTQVLALVGEDLLKAEINRHQIRWFRRYADEARTEVLRMHRWNCATERAELVQAAATVGSYPYTYALPGDCLRVLEVNGESYESGEGLFEVEAGHLFTHATTVWIRYIADKSLTDLDPLLQQAITMRHAAKIATVTSIPSAPMLESMFQKRLAEARQANSHVRSADNSPRARVAARSLLLRSRGSIRNPLRLEEY